MPVGKYSFLLFIQQFFHDSNDLDFKYSSKKSSKTNIQKEGDEYDKNCDWK